MAADISGDMVRPELALDQFHGGKDRPLRAAGAEAWRPRRHDLGQRARMPLLQRRRCIGGPDRGCEHARDPLPDEGADPLAHRRGGVLARHRQQVLARQGRAYRRLAQDLAERLFDVVGLPLFDQQHRAFALTELDNLVGDQRIGDVEDVERDAARSPDVGQAQPLQRAQHAVVHAALENDADLADIAGHEFIQPAFPDELHRGRPARLDLLLLMMEGGRRQHDAAGIALGRLQRLTQGQRRFLVGLGAKAATHMTGPDTDLEHDRRVRRLGQFETGLDGSHDALEIRLGIEQPDLRLHRKGMAALLHDRGAFAVILADDDQGAARDAAGSEIGQGVGRDIGADGRLEGDGAANRIHDRGGKRCSGRRLAGAGLEMNVELTQDLFGVGEHVHQMRDRRALVARDVSDARLQQRLGDGEDALAMELLPVTELEVLHFLRERSFGHGWSLTIVE